MNIYTMLSVMWLSVGLCGIGEYEDTWIVAVWAAIATVACIVTID